MAAQNDNNLLYKVNWVSHFSSGVENVLASFSYDPEGKLLEKNSSGSSVYYHYLGEQLLYKESGETKESYVWLKSSLIAIKRGDDTLFCITDHIGSVVMVTDSAKDIVWTASYSPFGAILNTTGTLDFTPIYSGKEYHEILWSFQWLSLLASK